jgi:hypothetical protein
MRRLRLFPHPAGVDPSYAIYREGVTMTIISGRHKCPGCGRVWTMPVNTSRPDWQEHEEAMKKGQTMLSTLCGSCQSKGK